MADPKRLKTRKQRRRRPISRGRDRLSGRLRGELLEERRLLAFDPLLTVPEWIAQGPAPITGGFTLGLAGNPVSGAIQAIAAHPSLAGTVYVGSVNGGIWKSTNADVAQPAQPDWTAKTDGFPSLSISAIAFDPADATNNTLYAGTGHFSSSASGEASVGLLKTTDGGEHWQSIRKSFFDGKRIVSIVPLNTPTGPVLLVATDDYQAQLSPVQANVPDQGGIFRSTNAHLDGTPTFLNVGRMSGANRLPSGSITDLAADPGNSSRVYAAVYGQGVYRSDDAGLTWHQVHAGLPAFGTAPAAGTVGFDAQTAVKLSVSAAAGNAVYAALLNPGGGVYQLSAVYRSSAGTDGVDNDSNEGTDEPNETSWTAIGTAPDVGPFTFSSRFSLFSLLADRTSATLVYIGGASQPVPGGHIGTLFIGDSAAGTWNSIVDAGAQTTAPHPDSRRMVFNFAGDILEADDGGLYRLENPSLATRKWFSANGDLQLTELVAAAYDSVNDLLLGGAQDNGAAHQQSPGKPGWTALVGGDGGIVHVEAVPNAGKPFAYHYYSAQELFGFSRRKTGPEISSSVEPIGLEIDGTAGTKLTDSAFGVSFLQPWVLNEIDPSRMLIGTTELYESMDRGDHLAPLQGVVIAGGSFVPAASIGTVTAMAYGGRFPDPAGGSIDVPNVAYVAAGGNLLLRRSQGQPLTLSYPGGTVLDIVLDPDNWHTAYLVDANSQVWRTTDAGATPAGWKNLTANLPGPISTIELVKTGGSTIVLAGGHGGLYRAVNPDNGLSWTRFGRGLPDVIVSDVDYNAQDDVLLVGTMGRGAWIVPNASAYLAQPTLLLVEGTDGNDMITVRRNADAAEMVEFVINGVVSQPLPLASVQSIVVEGFGGLDTLIINSTGGPISVPLGIEFNGHSDFDTLVFKGPTPISHTLNQPAADGSGSSWLTANDAFGNQLSQIVSFLNLENVQSDLASPATKRLAALGGGLQATADRLNERPQLGQAFAALDTSLAPALAGVSHDRGSPVDDAVAAAAPGDEGSESGTPLLRRLIESGLGSFSLLAIGEEESFTTSEQLRAALDALDEVDGNVSFTESADITTFDFRMTKRLAGAARFDVLAEALGGSIELDGAINVSADVQVHLVFGVDSDGFFIQPNAVGEPELVVSNVTVDGELTGSGRIGFLGVELTSGTLTVDPGVALSLKLEDPGGLASDGLIRLEELGPLAVAASAVLAGNPAADDVVLSGSFVVGALIPGLPAPFELAEADISLAWPDVTNPASVNVTAQAGGGEDLLNFLNVEGEQILSGFNQLVDWLEGVRDSSVFNHEVPLTNGTTLGEVVDVAGAFRDELMQFLEGEPGTASFSTVQELAINLARSLNIDLSTLGINYDPVTKDLTYHLDFDHAFEVSQVPLDLSLHAGTLVGVSTTSLLSLAAGADLEMDFGVSLASAVSAGSLADAFFVRDASLNAHVDVLADDIDASASLASFSIQVAGGAASGSAVLGISLLDPATGADDGRITLEELLDGLSDLDSIISSPGVTIDASFSLPVTADSFLLGEASVELSGLIAGSLDAIDYSLAAEIAGTLVAGLQIIDLGPGQPSNVALTKADGLNLEARADAFGVNFLLSGELDVSGSFSLDVTAEPFELGGLTIVLAGQITGTAGVLDYALEGDVSGELLPGVTIVELSPGVPSSVSLTKADGLKFLGRAEAFGLDLNIDGQFHATGNFNLLVSTDPFDIPGADGNVILAGSIFRNAAGLDWLLTALVSDWQPAPFLNVPLLEVRLSVAGLEFDAVADIGDLEDVHLFGDYDFDSGTFAIVADAPLDWEPVADVELTDALFTVTNRDANGLQTGVTACATADLALFGSDFTVAACVTPRGAWLVATPEGSSFDPVPGLSLDDAHLVASSYDFSDDDGSDDFAFDLDTLREVPRPAGGLTGRLRDIDLGINLVATSFLPDGIPGIGGSEVQIGGVIGASLPDMLIEALIVLDQPWVLADVIQIDLLGLRISGQPSLTIFGDGRILHDQIPGLDEDILVRAALSLTTTELNGSLSLLAPVHDVFGVEGLNIIEADVQVGISFVATPVPPPTVGFNFLVETPQIAQDLLSVPATLGASLKVSNVEPIFAMTVIDWVPYGNLGLTQFVVNEGSLVVAPNGGTIGTKVFDRGFSASFDVDIFGTNVAFLGVFDEDTQGIVMEGFVSAFEVAGIGITGEGPDGIFEDGVVSSPTDPDADNAVVFRAALTAAAPQNNGLAFSGRIDLPGEDEAGNPAFIELSGEFDSLGVVIQGEIQNWAIVPSVILIDEATFTLAILLDNPDQNLVAFTADLDLLGTHIVAAGSISGQGLALAGSLEPGNQQFAGVRVEQFGFSFSTLPADEHLGVNFQVDLPGAGGLVSVVGGFEDQILELDAQISNWQPIPTMVFAGSLHAEADLDTSSLELDFDVTGNVLGTSTQFVGSIFADPSGLALFATATVGLKFPGGLKVADLVATIDVGYTSPFFISLAADFRLPGTRPADVLLLGGIGTSGVTLAGSIDRWGLVPGLFFDGELEIEADFQATSLAVNIESDTHLLGTRLSLDGQLLAGPGVFNLDLEGSVRFQGQRFGFVDLDLDVELETFGSGSNRQYRLDFDGRLRALGGIIDVQASATLVAESDGGWLVTATVDFDPPEFSLDLGAVTMKLDFDASMSVQFGSDLDDLGLDLSGKLTASASISGLGSYSKTLASIDVSLNLDTGIIKIPNAKIKILKRFGVPYGIEWVDLNLKMGEPEPPTTTVTAKLIPNFKLLGEPPRLEIRGTAAPEFVRVLRRPPVPPPDIIIPTPSDRVIVEGANVEGQWVTLLTTTVGNLSSIDIDMGGGNDVIEISPLLDLPATIVGVAGADVIRAGAGPNLIYGGRRPGQEDDNQPGTGFGKGGLPGGIVFTGSQPDRGDLIFGGSPIFGGIGIFAGTGNDSIFGGDGNDTISGGGGNDLIDGGAGINIINGQLQIAGTARDDHIVVERDQRIVPIWASNISLDLPLGALTGQSAGVSTSAISSPAVWLPVNAIPLPDDVPGESVDDIVVLSKNRLGTAVTLFRTPVANLSSLLVAAGAGDDVVEVSQMLTLPVELRGGADNDVLRGGAGPNILRGGDGDDVLIGSTADDSLFGEAGDDYLDGRGGNDLLDGGPGDNTIVGAAGPDPVEGENPPPVVEPIGSFTVNEGELLTFTVMAGDSPSDGDGDGIIAQNTFDASDEGWRIGEFFSNAGDGIPAFLPSGGNPDGFIRTTDSAGVVAFQAPALFLGDQSAAYAKTLHLEQRLLTSDGMNYPMVLLSDGTLYLQFRTAPPGTDWTAYDIPLVASAGWEVSDLSDTADPDPAATEAQLQQVLGNLTLFNIRADWQTGSDQVDLDNVAVGDQAPGGDGDSVYQNDFEGTIGAEWTPVVRNSTPLGGRNFLGEFANDSVRLALAGLPAHTEITLSFDLFIIRSWDGNAGGGAGPDVFDVSLAGGPSLLHTTFSTTETVSGHEQAYPDAFPGGSHLARTGAAENNTLGYSLFVGEVGQVLPLDSVYRITLSFSHAEAAAEFVFSAAGLTGLSDESWGLDNVVVRLTSELPPGGGVHSFRDDFSTTANPAGPWSYGFVEPGGNFQLHPDGSLHSDGQFKWHGPGVPDALGLGLPAVFSTLVHPGSNGEKSAVRWTAPADGLYEIEVTFIDADNATTDVAVLHQSQLLSSGFVNLNGQGDSTSVSLTQFVFAGQTIDFVVGDGGNGYISDSTGLDATITLVTAVTFSAAADFSATQNPAGPWSYGSSDPSGDGFTLFPGGEVDESGLAAWPDLDTFNSFLPALFFNGGDTQAVVGPCGTADVQPGQLALHPGPSASAVVRWTAPASGSYTVAAMFTGIDGECPPTATVVVRHNTGDSEPNELFFDSIDDDGEVAAFSGSVVVAAGETLDFLVNDVEDLRFGGTIILDVVIRGETSTPPPPSGTGPVTFSLDPGAPEGAAIDPETGVFTWTPAAEHGPGAYIVTVRVTDEGTPPVSTTQTFLVTVVDPNEAPQIAAIDPVSVEQGSRLLIDVLATDPDVPANRIAFSLDEGAPAEASIDPLTGRFTWRPLRSTEPGTYDVTVRATDDGEPPLDATATFSITVTERTVPPTRDPEAGSFVIDPDGVAVYTKADTFQHVDRLAYLDDDGDDGVNLVTAEFTSEPFRNVSSLYEDLLGRGASDGEVINWTGRLDDATFRGVAGEFLASREYVQNVVQELFESLLDRPADAGGLDFWTGQLLGGTPADTVRALIAASEEYFARHASARDDFVVGLYEDLLERAPGEDEVAFWRTTLEQGATRDAVAKGFLASAEFRALLIREWYRDYLYREADDAGLDHWLGVMTTGQAQRQVQLELLASQEYQSEERLARGRLPRVSGPFEPD